VEYSTLNKGSALQIDLQGGTFIQRGIFHGLANC